MFVTLQNVLSCEILQKKKKKKACLRCYNLQSFFVHQNILSMFMQK